jgi:putative ABC transport system substrate-binding protein
LRLALEERGWIENRNLRIDVRWGPTDVRGYRELAGELVALAPDLLLAGGGLLVAPLQKATQTIPIVFTATVDPLALGYVASLSRPGGNTTGFINFEYSLCGKWLETLKQVAPHVKQVAVLQDPTVAIGTAQFKEIEKVAPRYAVEATPVDVRDRALSAPRKYRPRLPPARAPATSFRQ